MRPTKPANLSTPNEIRVSGDAFVWTALPHNIYVPAPMLDVYRAAYAIARERVSIAEATRRVKRRETIHLN